MSKADLDRLLNKALRAPSIGGGCFIPITVPYWSLLMYKQDQNNFNWWLQIGRYRSNNSINYEPFPKMVKLILFTRMSEWVYHLTIFAAKSKVRKGIALLWSSLKCVLFYLKTADCYNVIFKGQLFSDFFFNTDQLLCIESTRKMAQTLNAVFLKNSLDPCKIICNSKGALFISF